LKNFKQRYLAENLIVFNDGQTDGQVVFVVADKETDMGYSHKMFMEHTKFKQYSGKNWKPAMTYLEKVRTVFSESLPNIMFDVLAANAESIQEIIPHLLEFGYEPQNIHIGWAMSNYHIEVKRNSTRRDIYPHDVTLKTLDNSKFMKGVLNGKLPGKIDGDVKILLKNDNHAVKFSDSDNTEFHLKGLCFLSVKKSGQPMAEAQAIQAKLHDWLAKNAPDEHDMKKFFRTKISKLDKNPYPKKPKPSSLLQPDMKTWQKDTDSKGSTTTKAKPKAKKAESSKEEPQDGMVTVHRRHGGKIGFAFKRDDGKIAFSVDKAKSKIDQLKQAFPSDAFVMVPYQKRSK
jgi:hypothetical protein